jgi:type I restriction enzyme S subunit
MRSSYKKLGPYIRPVDIRNYALDVDLLLGVSVQKLFIPSIANTVGTDFSKYKIVRRKQFTYIADTSRRGDKIGIAMLEQYEEALVSSAYTVFEVLDHNDLDPEYLMMWFRRPEFDRYARFKSHGSVREIFDWEEMCEVELPIPSIEKQREIVKEYNTIVNRIKLNEQFNQKLEETAQALYKHWFVDFEFPNENGKPYKSSGGTMVWNDELEKEIPQGWEVDSLFNSTSLINRGISPNYTESTGIVVINQKCIRHNTVDLSFSRLHDLTKKKVAEEKKIQKLDVLVNSTGTGTLGRVGVVKNLKSEMTADSHVTIVRANKRLSKYYLGSYLSNNEHSIVELGEGSTGQTELSRTNLGAMELVIPSVNIQKDFDDIIERFFNHNHSIESFKPQLLELKELVLAKMTKVEVEEKEVVDAN